MTSKPEPACRAAGEMPFGYFNCAYVINLDRDTDRMANMSARLGRLGVPFERWPATAARADERLFPERPKLTPGYFACARSHLALLRAAMQRGVERVIVLEDDAVFRDDAGERMASIVPRLRQIDWDVFYFGLHVLEAGGRLARDLGIVKRSFHSHAYAVSRRAMPAVIEIIETAMRSGFHFDCHETSGGKPPLLRVYADPILAVQEPNVSGVLEEEVDRLGQYFPPFDREEFFAHCAEARGWQSATEGGANAIGRQKGSEAPLCRPAGLTTADSGKAHEAVPNTSAEHNNLGLALRKQGEPERAAIHFRKAIDMRPERPEAHSNLGIALYEQGKPAEAVPHLETAIVLRPDFVDAHWNLALSLLSVGEFDRGWLEYEWRKRLPVDMARHRPPPQPEWNGCYIAGRTILVVCEQGLGDTLQFIRYLPMLISRGARVIVECPAPLCQLLKTMARMPADVRVIARGARPPAFDTHIRLMSLPGMSRTRLETIPAGAPYLDADPVRVREWAARLAVVKLASPRTSAASGAERANARPFRIGIAWQGDPTFAHDRERSVPLREFAPLAAVPGVRLFSLQKFHGLDQLPEARKRFGIIDFSPPLDHVGGAFLDTAAVMANLDLVVSSDTSIVHLAGALGVGTWMATSYACDWRWLREREDSPWYPSLRLFRQPTRGDWEAVFQRMGDALRMESWSGR